MTGTPSIHELWDFNDLEQTEQRFRQWIDKTSQVEPFHYELKTQLARTHSLRNRFEDSHAILDEVEPHIHISKKVHVRYLLERGRTFRSAGNTKKALPLFEEVWKAGKEAKLDRLAIDALHMLAITTPEFADQVPWHLKALEVAENSTQKDAKSWVGVILNNLGWTYHDLHDYEKALDTFQKALTWREQEGKTDAIHKAKYAVANTLRHMNRYQEAIDMLKPMLQEQIRLNRVDGFIQEEIGECYLALDRTERAQPHFEMAYQLLKDVSWITPERLERIKQLAQA